VPRRGFPCRAAEFRGLAAGLCRCGGWVRNRKRRTRGVLGQTAPIAWFWHTYCSTAGTKKWQGPRTGNLDWRSCPPVSPLLERDCKGDFPGATGRRDPSAPKDRRALTPVSCAVESKGLDNRSSISLSGVGGFSEEYAAVWALHVCGGGVSGRSTPRGKKSNQFPENTQSDQKGEKENAELRNSGQV